uniref:Uncharacterized protein n=1 Tax=Oryza sativa subsp. japonica TaxID=39947 RepID=Q6K6H6_ORYSJ|nr:hypothetical protein [Oryza sativa Japonica Group]BAD21984.1 hypothetical protein [Oryza sativa Japonica Group]
MPPPLPNRTAPCGHLLLPPHAPLLSLPCLPSTERLLPCPRTKSGSSISPRLQLGRHSCLTPCHYTNRAAVPLLGLVTRNAKTHVLFTEKRPDY